jgi:hypothetical protein
MKSTLVAALLVFALLAPCAAIAADGDAAAVAVVSGYVREHKHWKDADYQIRRDRTEDQCIVFLVTYLPEQKRAVPGGGKTFEAYYDPTQRKVVKEMHFQ